MNAVKMHAQPLTVLIVILLASSSAEGGVTLNYCGGDATDKIAEVMSDRTELNAFTCSGINKTMTVDWKLDNYPAGTCHPLPAKCELKDLNDGGAFVPSRNSDRESVMTIYPEKLRNVNVLGTSELHCQEMRRFDIISSDFCLVDYVKAVADGTCRAEFMTSSRPWRVKVTCDVTKGESLRNRHGCRFYGKFEQDQTSTSLSQWEQVTAQNVCSGYLPFDHQKEGRFDITARLLPGRTSRRAYFQGDNEIQRPSAPTYRCFPGSYVPVNKTLTCECETASLGKPPGLLQWSTGVGDEFENKRTLVVGRSGEKTLQMSSQLFLEDNLRVRFRCDVVWAEDVSSKKKKKAKVGYPANQVTLFVNPITPVKENGTATFTCLTHDGRPSPVLTLRRRSGEEMGRNESTLTFEKTDLRCEDSDMYSCTANNDMGPAKTVETLLNVTCPPRALIDDLPPLNFIDEEIQFMFNVIANPAPHTMHFYFLGSSKNNQPSKVKDIALHGWCEMRHGDMFRVMCSVVVDNATSEADGFYQGTLENDFGSVDFIFEVKVNATIVVPPSSSTSNVIIIGAVCGGVAALGIIIFIVIVIKKRGSGMPKGHNDHSNLKSDENKNLADGAHIYGNIDTKGNPTPANQGVTDSEKPTQDDGYEVNQDGLLYVSVDFSDNKPPTPRATPPPREEGVLYSAVDFTKTAPAE